MRHSWSSKLPTAYYPSWFDVVKQWRSIFHISPECFEHSGSFLEYFLRRLVCRNHWYSWFHPSNLRSWRNPRLHRSKRTEFWPNGHHRWWQLCLSRSKSRALRQLVRPHGDLWNARRSNLVCTANGSGWRALYRCRCRSERGHPRSARR